MFVAEKDHTTLRHVANQPAAVVDLYTDGTFGYQNSKDFNEIDDFKEIPEITTFSES